MTNNLKAARSVLKGTFGYDNLKPAQERVIEAALEGSDVLAVLPTGYGKSVCFQVPALMRDGCAIVISPLIALMKDQVDGAKRRGIPATFINSHIDSDEAAERVQDFISGAVKLLYIAPERISSESFRAALSRANVSYIVVDEAHCASMWGHDFRPAYKRISEIADILWESTKTRPPILALTATATAAIEEDITTAIGMAEEYTRVIGDPVRPNLNYDVVLPSMSEWSAVMRQAHQALRTHPDGRHLIYCGARKAAEKVADMLTQDGVPNVQVYHGGQDRAERTAAQEAFVSGKSKVCCATNAFGMGIDVPDIRTVIHFGIPGSLEAYVQEAGRAGRDGQPSNVILIRSQYSETMQGKFVLSANPPITVYSKVWEYLLNETTPGQAMVRSTEQIALALDPSGRELSGDQISTVLSVMEGHRLVHRQSYEGGAPTEIRAGLDRFAAKDDVVGKVARYLLKLSKSFGSDRFAIDRTDAPFDAGISASAFNKALRLLVDADVLEVGRTFTGKTTTVLRRDVDLLEAIPVEMLERRRKIDLARLQAVIDYQHVPANERRTAIRTYFGLTPT